MMWFVEMRNRKESFPRAGIERVSIEENFCPQRQRSSVHSIFIIERAEGRTVPDRIIDVGFSILSRGSA